MTDKALDIQRYGLSVVSNPPDALVDVVFVHGLNGHPQRTWTGVKLGTFWPSQLLPEFVKRVRVLTYGYDADITSLAGPGATKDRIHNHAERLLASLHANRNLKDIVERPLIFVAHSLGGLIVKRALISSYGSSGQKTHHLRSIYASTYAILFLGTPHMGSAVASWGTYLEGLTHVLMPKKALDTAPQLIEALKSNSETLVNIDRQFVQLLDDFHLYFFHEAKPTDFKGTLRFIVEEDSAAPTLPDVERAGIQNDHQHMAKFDSENSPGFDLVVEGIRRYAREAPEKIQGRWRSEKEQSRIQVQRKIKELYDIQALGSREPMSEASSVNVTPGSSSIDLIDPIQRKTRASRNASINASTDALLPPASQPEPLFIVPPGFRPNTFFVGMEKEIKLLDQRLFDKQKRQAGTASVLLYGQPGVGKTHVARQYIYQNRHKFPGGIFWVNAFLKGEMYNDYWQIQEKVVRKVAPTFLPVATPATNAFIKIVKDWFQNRQDWLLVFDGVGDEENDIDELNQFIPDNENCSLIYIARSRRLETMQRLLHPWPVKVSPLKDDQGRSLLFKEIGIKKPRESQMRSAVDLSRKVGGLPLAITAIARRLADTHEPIEKFNFGSYSQDPKLGGTYGRIINELENRSYPEAMNLVRILCFYGPHIPVEMINLGIKVLYAAKISVKTTEDGNTEDLNGTFSILMRYALIERNDPDDSESMSSSRDSLSEPEPIDIVNMHAVVQKFWCDSLYSSKVLPTWLGVAIHLFIESFKHANKRLSCSDKPARVSDYRWYLTHGERLREHTYEYENKRQSLQTIRSELEPTLNSIYEEIRNREPGSSQESVSQTVFQASIFDRTVSSSSSGHSDHPGRLLPLQPLNEDDSGIPFQHRLIDSPTSILSADIVQELDAQLHRGYHFHDFGFLQGLDTNAQQSSDTNIDNGYKHSLMPANLYASTGVCSNDGIETPRVKDWRSFAYGRGGSIKPQSVSPQINIGHVYGSMTSQPPYPIENPSQALASLELKSQNKPKLSRERPSWIKYWSRSSVQEPKKPSSVETIADDAIDKAPKVVPATQHDADPFSEDFSDLSQRRRSSARTGTSTESGQPSSTHTGPYKSYRISRESSTGLPLIPDSESSQEEMLYQSHVASRTSFQSEPDPLAHPHSIVSGPNPNQLPYESNVSLHKVPSQPRPDFNNQPIATPSRPPSQPPTEPDLTSYQQSFQNPFSPSFQRESSIARSAYSQPMSRDQSGQSRNSDPWSQPSLPYPFSHAVATTPVSAVIRGRMPDGSPLNKSPKFHSAPIGQHAFSPEALPMDPSHHRTSSASLTRGAGWMISPAQRLAQVGTTSTFSNMMPRSGSPVVYAPSAFRPPPSTPASITSAASNKLPSPASTGREISPVLTPKTAAQYTSTAAADTPMSRNSSAPGLAIPGLGIAPFGEPAQAIITTQEPNDVAAARRHAWDLHLLGLQEQNNAARYRAHAFETSAAQAVSFDARRESEAQAAAMYSRQQQQQQLLENVQSMGAYQYEYGSSSHGSPNAAVPVPVPAPSANQQPLSVPWGYSSGYGPGSLHPAMPSIAPVVAGIAPELSMEMPLEMPDVDTLRQQPLARDLSSAAMAADGTGMAMLAPDGIVGVCQGAGGRQRRNSAPESPGWSGRKFWGS